MINVSCSRTQCSDAGVARLQCVWKTLCVLYITERSITTTNREKNFEMKFSENSCRGTVACMDMYTYFTIALFTGLIPVYTISGSSSAIKFGVKLHFFLQSSVIKS